MTATRQLPVNGNQIRRKDTDKNSLGLTLEDYVNAQILACTELKIPVLMHIIQILLTHTILLLEINAWLMAYIRMN